MHFFFSQVLMDLNKPPQDHGVRWEGKLFNHDGKPICSVYTGNAPVKLPSTISISCFEPATRHNNLRCLPTFEIHPQGPEDVKEWKKFLIYLKQRAKVAAIFVEGLQMLIKSPEKEPAHLDPAQIAYQYLNVDPDSKVPKVFKAAAQMHPEYLTTLSQTHASWLFGGVAELIDNARDAQAKRLFISVAKGTLKTSEEVPMLCFLDNGVGMNHKEIVEMVSFGHKRPEEDNPNQVGRFGVGFKTGAMRLGKDAIVFTQTNDTRSIALLSTSYNEEKDVLEVPIVTYVRHAGRMDFDMRVQTKEQAKASEKAIMDYSPFDKYGIGSEFVKLGDGTGTLIYVYNLERWGSDYSLNWEDKKGDITIRSKRVRTRPGQASQEVPLDYSLRAYLEVMFLEPYMIISIQGTQVKTKRLANALNNTKKVSGVLLGKRVDLTLGRSETERNRGNCGIFLYWHGRLIEAYKRVGNMVHSADWARGVIGVVETTGLMDFAKGKVGVLNNKQGFEDSEAYAALEKWLGDEADKYWEIYGEKLYMEDSEGFPPDLDWVQCNKCLKWRILRAEWGVNSDSLPEEWFCYMPPYNGSCKNPEEKQESGVVTVGTKRSVNKVRLEIPSKASVETSKPGVPKSSKVTQSKATPADENKATAADQGKADVELRGRSAKTELKTYKRQKK